MTFNQFSISSIVVHPFFRTHLIISLRGILFSGIVLWFITKYHSYFQLIIVICSIIKQLLLLLHPACVILISLSPLAFQHNSKAWQGMLMFHQYFLFDQTHSLNFFFLNWVMKLEFKQPLFKISRMSWSHWCLMLGQSSCVMHVWDIPALSALKCLLSVPRGLAISPFFSCFA